MNRAIARLFVLTMFLFAVLIAFTSRWTVFEADALRANAKNQRDVLRARFIERGEIRAADGAVLAKSVRAGDRTWSRRYPEKGLFAHAVGYSYTRIGQAGLERSRNDVLTGELGQLDSLIDRLSGEERVGADVRTTLVPAAQQVALQQLGDRKGAIVALDPRSGDVLALASTPGFDPNALRGADALKALNTDEDNAPLVNRVTQAAYPPGSTMKVVTAIAAIDSGRFKPESTVDGGNDQEISGRPLSNFGGKDFGDVTLTTALTNSVNTAWANVAEKLGAGTMQRYMDRLGFGEQVPIDLPSAARAPSGAFVDGKVVPATDDRVDIGRLAIGQDRLLATPLQMAMVAAAVANDGELMTPRLTARVVDADGRVVEDLRDGERFARVMSQSSARAVKGMMTKVVEEGSGTAAALQGISVAGKTGTAEVSRRGCDGDQLWFIALAPAAQPKVAIAATLECAQGTGGEAVAPIAKAVMETLLR